MAEDDRGEPPDFLRELALGLQHAAKQLGPTFEAMDQLGKAVAPSAQRAAEQLAEATVPIVHAYQVDRVRLNRLVPNLREWARKAQWFQQEAPTTLQKLVIEAGHVPSPDMPFRFYTTLVSTYHEKGTEPALRYFDAQTLALASDDDWRQRARTRWESYPLRAGRAAIMVEAFDAYVCERYAVAVPTLVAQTEGVIADAMDFDKTSSRHELEDLLKQLAEDAPILGPAFQALYSPDVWFARFPHGSDPIDKSDPTQGADPTRKKPFRNAILHGIDVRYAREPVARKALLWLDTVIQLALAKKGAELADEQAPVSEP